MVLARLVSRKTRVECGLQVNPSNLVFSPSSRGFCGLDASPFGLRCWGIGTDSNLSSSSSKHGASDCMDTSLSSALRFLFGLHQDKRHGVLPGWLLSGLTRRVPGTPLNVVARN